MAAVHSARSLDRSQARVELASLHRWQRQQKAVEALSDAVEQATAQQRAALRSAGFGYLLPDYNAPRLSHAAG